MKKIVLIIFLVLVSLFLIPQQMQAGLVPCGLSEDDPEQPGDQTVPCTLCHFFVLFNNIINFIFFTIVPPLAILMIAIAGGYFLLSSGNPSALARGKEILKATAIALIIIYGAWLIVNLIFTTIGVADWTGLEKGWKEGWFQIECSTGP